MLVHMGLYHTSSHPLDAKENYRILIRGSVDLSWFDRLGRLTISKEHLPDGTVITTLSGELRDQSALIGILNTLHDLGLPLISVERVTPESSDRCGTENHGELTSGSSY